MELDSSLPCSQEPATGPYPETDESSPHPHPIPQKSILILFFHLCLDLIRGLFFEVFLPKPLVHASPMCASCPAQLILLV
jgi:hypothetical protein